MIAKITKGGGFRGVLNYNFDDVKSHEIIDSNLIGETPKELANEFSLSRKMNENLSRPVFHVSLSLPIDENLENEKLKNISNGYLKKMGFDNTQFVVIKHNDTKHQHIHIVASRIDFDGKTISDKNDVYRSIEATRELEKEYKLTEVVKKENEKSKHYDKKESDFQNRTGLKFTKENIKTSIDGYFKNNQAKTIPSFLDHLNKNNINVQFNLAKTGHVSGVSFKSGEFSFKGSAINKDLSFANLAEKLNYNPSNDLNSLKLSNYLAEKNLTAKSFESTSKYYNHLFKESSINPDTFNHAKSFAVINKINPVKLEPVLQKWDQGDYTISPKEFLSNAANQLVNREKEGFNSRIESINRKLPDFFTPESSNKIFNDLLSNKYSKDHLDKTLDSIEKNAAFIPKNMKEALGVSPDDYFKHKLDTFQSPEKKNKAFFQFEKLQKQRLVNNLIVFSKNMGYQIDIDRDKSSVKGLNFNYNELKNLDKLNTEFEKGIYKNTPVTLIDKQFNLNKLDKFEYIYKTTEDLNTNHKTSISSNDLNVIYGHVKQTGFDTRVPNIIKSFSNDIKNKLIPGNTDIVKYTEDNLKNPQRPMLSNQLFKTLDKFSKTAQHAGAKTKVNKQQQEEDENKKKGMQID